jgi:hypothetical protein
MVQVRRWHRDCQSRSLYLEKISFKKEWQNKDIFRLIKAVRIYFQQSMRNIKRAFRQKEIIADGNMDAHKE